MNTAQLRWLAEKSGVSFGALVKLRLGTTANPRIGTIEKFAPHVRAALKFAPVQSTD